MCIRTGCSGRYVGIDRQHEQMVLSRSSCRLKTLDKTHAEGASTHARTRFQPATGLVQRTIIEAISLG